jgi:hypothetical protein
MKYVTLKGGRGLQASKFYTREQEEHPQDVGLISREVRTWINPWASTFYIHFPSTHGLSHGRIAKRGFHQILCSKWKTTARFLNFVNDWWRSWDLSLGSSAFFLVTPPSFFFLKVGGGASWKSQWQEGLSLPHLHPRLRAPVDDVISQFFYKFPLKSLGLFKRGGVQYSFDINCTCKPT